MSTSRSGTAPGTWDDARDSRFFRITSRLFPPDVCLGATVLLASYDDEPGPRPSQATAPCVVLAPQEGRAPEPVRPARGSAA